MRTRNVLFVLVVMVVSPAATASRHPNLAEGFQPGSIFTAEGIDTVNAFNGNLTLAIPIGHSYPIGGGLSYQLRLFGNSTVWEAEERLDLNEESGIMGDCNLSADVIAPCVHAFPDRRANAGFGWTLSLGRLFPPASITNDEWQSTNETGGWMYESPDGREHRFRAPGPAGALYSTDGGLYLRLRQDGTRVYVDFPNGEVHTFVPDDDPTTPDDDEEAVWAPYLLEKISNQFSANALTVRYQRNADHRIDQWTLSDGFRQHTVHFAEKNFESGVLGVATPNNRRMLVTSVVTSEFGGTTGTFTFDYGSADAQRTRPDWHNIPKWYASAKSTVQLLETLTLPDGLEYDFVYEGDSFSSALFDAVELPMGGRIEWDFQWYGFPKTGEHGVPYLDRARGVNTRRLVDRNEAVVGTWTYSPALDFPVFPTNPAPRELVNTVTDPLGNMTRHYFNVFPAQHVVDIEPPLDYGKPFTRKTSITRQPDDVVYLSTRFLAAGTAAPVLLRSTYVRMDADYEQVVASRSIYHDDNGAFLDETRSDFDGLGNYRTTTTGGTGVPTRVSTTMYNPGSTPPNDVLAPASSRPWLLKTFTSRTVSDGTKTLQSEYLFDPPTSSTPGFLRRTRAIKDTVSGTRGPEDVIVAFTPDSRGNIASEEHYGGDGAALSTGLLGSVTLDPGARQYRIVYQYSNGSLAKSRFHAADGSSMSFYTVDNDIDASTGFISTSRDTSGIPTTATYDVMGRLSKVTPTGRAWSNYVYPTFTIGADNVVDDDIVVTRHAPGTTSTASWLGRSRYRIDSLGRVTTEFTEMPGGSESRRETRYNALGWKLAVSELGTAATLPETIFEHDAFGRVSKSTAPDGSETSFDYDGIRRTARTAFISTSAPPAPDTAVTTVEESDLYGRLVRVTEKSGPTTAASPIGASVVTAYRYDPADRLTGVLMNQGGTAVQERAFDYDGRGFLRWESHPEAGVTSYTYDSRGNVKSRTQGQANSPFDLEYTYDAAGRVKTVKGRNPFYGHTGQEPFRLVKSFEYGTDAGAATSTAPADLRNGRLVRATRFNYGLGVHDLVYRIDQVYEYRDLAGRTSGRTTVVTRADGHSSVDLKEVRIGMAYDALDLPVTISYPMCVDCGGPPVDPAREQIVRTYDHGRLVKLERPAAVDRQGQTIPAQTFVSNMTFWPNGMRNQLVHGNQITDTQTVGNMARPTQLSFGRYDRCVQPTFSLQPVSVTGGSAVRLSVTVAGTGPFTYEWWNASSGTIVGGDAPAVTVNPAATTEYYVIVTGACGIARSHTAKVSIPDCAPPSTGSIHAVRQPDGSWILRPNPTARGGAQYEWRQLPSNTILGYAETQAVGVLSASTTFRLTITDSCGSASSDVTVQVPLPITRSGLVAAWDTARIVVTWPAVPGATRYVLERRSGAAWEVLRSDLATPSYTDSAIQSNRTYAYRVYAVGDDAESDYSNSDVATTRTFTEAVPNTPVNPAPAESMLAAVNSVRAAAGWPALTWNNILAPNDPLPRPSSPVIARHVMSCRSRMNEALQALGSRTVLYTNPDLNGAVIAAADINDVLVQAR